MLKVKELIDLLRSHGINRAYRYNLTDTVIHIAVAGSPEKVAQINKELNNSTVKVAQLDDSGHIPRSFIMLM